MQKSIRTEIIINASKEKLWQVLTDFSKYPEWNPFLVSIKGKAQQGTRLQNTMFNGNTKMVFKPTVMTVKEYTYFDWIGHLWVKGLFDGHHYFEIEELSPTQVKLAHGEQFSGLLSSYIFKKIGKETRNNFVKMNMALKQRVEQL